MRALVVAVAVVGVASFVLTQLDTQVTTPIGSMGTGRGRFPVVEIAGLGSDGSGFSRLTTQLQHDGVTVIDFRPDVAGIQPLSWKASSPDVHIPQLATQTVAPAIDDAVRRAGFDPARQVIDVVAHSVGGLIMRYLIEKTETPPTANDILSWAARVDDLVMVATPNHGTRIGFLEATLGPGHSDWDGIAADMAPRTESLTPGGERLRRTRPGDRLGCRKTSEPPGEVYTTIGGDPWLWRWLRNGHHGFDGAVPAESPFLRGAAHYTFPQTHGRLLATGRTTTLIDKVTSLGTG